MEDEAKTKEQILEELGRLQRENARLKESRRQWEKTKNALAKAEERLDVAIGGSKSGLWDIILDPTDPKALVPVEIYISPRLKELVGYGDHELPNTLEAWLERILPDDLRRVQKRAQAFLSGRADTYEDEYRVRRKDDSIRWHQSRGRLYREADGAPLRWIGINWDVTERKKADVALKEREEIYRELFNNMKSGMAVYKAKDDGEDFIFVDFNEPAERIENVKKQDIIGRSVLEVFPGVKDLGLFDVLQRVWKTGRPERHANGFYQDERIKGWRENYVYKVPSGGIVAVYDDITERKKAEIALKESEERYRVAFELAPVGVGHLTATGRYLLANQRLCEIVGYTSEELRKMTTHDITHPDDKEEGRGFMEKIGTGEIARYAREKRYLRKDGSIVWVHITVSTARDSAGRPKYFITVVQDISERKKAEKSLKESQERFRDLARSLPETIFETNREGTLTFANEQAFARFGYSRRDFEGGLKCLEMIAHKDRERAAENINELMAGRDLGLNEYNALRKDGATFPVLMRSTPITKDGEKVGLRGFIIDISERKKVDEALRKSEERYRFITENATDVIWQADLNGNFQFLSPAFERLTGWSLKEGLSLNLKDIMTSESYELTYKLIAKKIAAPVDLLNTFMPPLILPLEALRKNGSSFMAEASVRFLRDGQGRPIGLTGVTRDVTERKQAEESLKKLTGDLRERVKELNCLYSVSNLLSEPNKSQDETLNSIVRLLPTAFLYPERTCARIKLDDRTFETDNFQETSHRLASDIKSAQGEFMGFMEIFLREKESDAGGRSFLKEEAALVDAITDRISDWLEKKRTEIEKQKFEVQLRQAQKMEALGTLAGGIAHDFNNILAVIMGHAEIALEKGRLGEDDSMGIKQVLEAAVRASNLVKQILTFSRKVETDLKPLNLNHEIAHSIELLERTIPKMIGIEMYLADDLKLIKGDPNQMDQIQVNLVTNAIDAMPSGGRLVIETENVILDDHFCKAHIGVLPGRYILWRISDTGEGIDEETQKHIFNPFFTTKEVGKGTGLGLSTVYGIVKSHGGHISCYSQPGMGTTFSIYLPALQDGETQIAFESESHEPETQGEETLLVVDDEKALRESTTEILKRRGYNIYTAGSGEEALEIYKGKGDQIDLVILDVGMPGMGGLKCFEELVKIDPKIKVIIASGYSVEGQLKHTAALKAAGFIGKPYRLRDILGKVREVLAAKD